MPALAMAMSSSLRWACLNSLTYSSLWVKGRNTLTRISVGCRSTCLQSDTSNSLYMSCSYTRPDTRPVTHPCHSPRHSLLLPTPVTHPATHPCHPPCQLACHQANHPPCHPLQPHSLAAPLQCSTYFLFLQECLHSPSLCSFHGTDKDYVRRAALPLGVRRQGSLTHASV